MNNRRKLLHALGACTLFVPMLASAQQQKSWRIGVLNIVGETYDALRQGMHELGYIEGKNVHYERRLAEGKYEHLPALAAELVTLRVDVIAVGGTVATRAAQQATRVIPIVMVNVGDPIGRGFIASLARPGGNITGLTNFATELYAKRLELLLAAPRVSRVAALLNPDNPNRARQQDLLAAAKTLGVSLLSFDARNPEEIDRAFAAMSRERAEALIVGADNVFSGHRHRIVGAAAKARLPAIFSDSRYVDDGGLMSYGINQQEYFRKAAMHVHKILKGAKPAELPVEQPTTLELVINMKTAKALGIVFPQTILLRADRVIE